MKAVVLLLILNKLSIFIFSVCICSIVSAGEYNSIQSPIENQSDIDTESPHRESFDENKAGLDDTPREDTYENLEQRFKEALFNLEQLATLHPNEIFLWIWDLDETLVHNEIVSSDFKNKMRLQQEWLYNLDAFLKRHENIILIYNTSRFELELISKRDLSPFDQPLGIKNENNEMIAEWPLIRLKMKNDAVYGIPLPNAVITGAGRCIGIIDKHHNNIIWIDEKNSLLTDWSNDFSSDLKKYFSENKTRRFKCKVFKKKGHAVVQKLFFMPDRKEEEDRIVQANIQELKKNTDEYTLVTPTYRQYKPNQGNTTRAFITETCVNKGTSLRILLNLMHSIDRFNGKPVHMFVFGDNLIDMTMIRPDHESGALAELSEEAKQAKEKRLSEILQNEGISTTEIWALSIVFDAERLGNSNPHIRKMLSHPKICSASSRLGLLSALETLLAHIPKTLIADPRP